MPGPVPGIHVLLPLREKDVDGRTSPAMTAERERRIAPTKRYGVMETGEKSTNQLFGCTKPLIFGLIARGATSCAT
jgi:hypothetical protein